MQDGQTSYQYSVNQKKKKNCYGLQQNVVTVFGFK